MLVRDVMTSDPVTVQATDPISAALDALFEADIRHLPVVRGEALVGMISDRDVRDLGFPIDWENDGAEAALQQLANPIASVMNSEPIRVDEETEIADVIDLIITHRIGAIPVVDPDTLHPVGIVSYVDILRAVRDNV